MSDPNELEPGVENQLSSDNIDPSHLDARLAAARERANEARSNTDNPIANVAKAAQELNKEEPPKE